MTESKRALISMPALAGGISLIGFLALTGCTQRSADTQNASAAPAAASAASTPVVATQPDLKGVWNRYPPYPDTFSQEPWPDELQVVAPPLKEPYLTEWKNMRKRREDADKANKPLATPSARCIPEGMPAIMGAHYAIEFLQTPGQFTVIAEFLSQVRRVYLDEPVPKPEEVEPSFNGYSVGKWVGNTLEVTTYGVKPNVQYEDIPHSAKMRISERIYLVGDILHNDFVIEDPEYLTGPYKFTFKYKKEKPDYKIGDYFCENDKHVIDKDGTIKLQTK